MTGSKIIAMIPARKGSVRLKAKNLALLNGRPLISYPIQAAIDANIYDRIILNADDDTFKKIADEYKVEFYKRPAELGSSTSKIDSVIYDFMNNFPSQVLAWVNPASPLQTGKEIRDVTDYYFKREIDTLITVKDENVHCAYNGKPINFTIDDEFAQTQDLIPVQRFVYSVMMWRGCVFREDFEKKGRAAFSGKIGYFPVSRESAIIIKKPEDLKLAECILKGMELVTSDNIQYDPLFDKIEKARD